MSRNNKSKTAKKQAAKGRRKLLLGGLLLLTWPLLRFISFKLPRKLVQVKVVDPIPLSGVLTQKEFFLFESNEKHWALSRKCTHLGCTVNYQETENVLECPCHQSRFLPESGTVIQGPATRPLARFPVEKLAEGAGYVVTIDG